MKIVESLGVISLWTQGEAHEAQHGSHWKQSKPHVNYLLLPLVAGPMKNVSGKYKFENNSKWRTTR